MGIVSASTTRHLTAEPQLVADALADYATNRPRILPENYHDYEVIKGGKGAGTEVAWVLQATKKRSRNVRATITVSGNPAETWKLTETDANSSLVTVYTVTPHRAGAEVNVTTSWTGAGGVGGFFEKTFAPLGLRKIQEQTLANLEASL